MQVCDLLGYNKKYIPAKYPSLSWVEERFVDCRMKGGSVGSVGVPPGGSCYMHLWTSTDCKWVVFMYVVLRGTQGEIVNVLVSFPVCLVREFRIFFN